MRRSVGSPGPERVMGVTAEQFRNTASAKTISVPAISAGVRLACHMLTIAARAVVISAGAALRETVGCRMWTTHCRCRMRQAANKMQCPRMRRHHASWNSPIGKFHTKSNVRKDTQFDTDWSAFCGNARGSAPETRPRT